MNDMVMRRDASTSWFIVVCLISMTLLCPSSLMAAMTGTSVSSPSYEAASENMITVNFDPGTSVASSGKIHIRFPFGFKLHNAALTAGVPGAYSTFIDFTTNTFQINRTSGTPMSGPSSLNFSGIRKPERAGSTGPYHFTILTAANSITGEDANVVANTIVANGPFNRVEPLTRVGGPVKAGVSFKIKIGVMDQYGNLSSGAPGTVTLIKNVGSGVFTPTLVSYANGVAEFSCTYSIEGMFALSARLDLAGSGVFTQPIGNYVCLANLMGPSAPAAPLVVPSGLSPLDWALEWEESLTPNVIYEVWQQHLGSNQSYQNYAPTSAYNAYMDYAEYRTVGNYNRYFSTFSNDAAGNPQWRMIGTTSYAKFVPNATYSSFLIDNYNLGEATGYDNFTYGTYFTDKWHRRHYGAFRIVAVDATGNRSTSTHEVMRAPRSHDISPVQLPQDSLLPSPEDVVVFNEGGQVTIQWFAGDSGAGSGMGYPDLFHIYRKVGAIGPGAYNDFAQYSRFEYFASTSGTSHVFTYDSSFASYHEYSSFTSVQPYGVFKVVAAKFDKRKSSSSAESFTLPYNPFGSQSGVSLDIVQYPPTPVSADQGMKVVLRLVDSNNNPLYSNSTTQVQLSMPHSSATTVQASGGYLHFNNIRQYVAGTHTMSFQVVGSSTTVPISHTVTADARYFTVRVDGTKIVPGSSTTLADHFAYIAGTTVDETKQVSFQVTVDAVDRHGNVSTDLTGRKVRNVGLYHSSTPAGFTNIAGRGEVTLTNGSYSFTITSDLVIPRTKVTLDVTGQPGFTHQPSVWFTMHNPVRVKCVTFDDIDHNGSTDRMIVTFDAPILDNSIPTTNPVPHLYLHRPGYPTATQAWTWNSYGLVNDTAIAFILSNPESSGTEMKFPFYQQKKGKPQKCRRIRSTKGAYLADFVTTDITISKVNKQTPVVTSSTVLLATRNGTLRTITLDFSGVPPAVLGDPNRWFVVANDGTVLTVTGVGRRAPRNSLSVSLDGNLLGDSGQPHLGFVNMDPNLVPSGLVAIAGGSSTVPAIDLYWSAFNNPLLEQFVIFRSTSPSSGFSSIGMTTTRTFSDTTITTGTTYYYYVRALLDGGEITQASQVVSDRVVAGIPTVNVSATPTSGTAPLVVDFSGTILDGGSIVAYEWDFNTADGIAVNFYSATSPETTFTYMEPGSYTAKLKVRDNDGNTAQATVSITVNAPANGPTAGATANLTGGPSPLTVTFADSSTAGSSPIRSWEWDFQGDGIIDYSSAVTGNASWTYRKADTTFSGVKLRVTDTLGRSDIANFEITVGSATNPPQVTLDVAAATDASGSPITLINSIPFIVTFNATTYDKAPGKIRKWQWDFNGDGYVDRITTFDDGPRTVTYAYANPGSYSPTVTVWDNEGNTASDTSFLEVQTPINANIYVVEPVTLDNVGGDQIMVRAVACPNSVISTVLFEYSLDNATWTQFGNTITTREWCYFRALDLTGFANNTWIYVRSRCTDTSSGNDTSPVVKIKKVSNALAEVFEDIQTDGQITMEVSFDATLAQDIFNSMGAGIEIPLGAISNDAILRGGLRLVIEQQGDDGVSFGDTDGLPTSGGLPTITNIGNTFSYEINLGDGTNITQPDSPLTLKIPYDDVNDDGIVDGTSYREEDLAVYYFDTFTGAWVRALTWTIDTENNIIEVTTVHLTDFGMFATVVSGAIGGSAGGPGAAAAGMCLVDGQQVPLGLLAVLGALLLLSMARWTRLPPSAR